MEERNFKGNRKKQVPEETMGFLEYFLQIILIISLISIGWFGNILYEDYTNQRAFNGLMIRNTDKNGAIEISYELDNIGDWICVNIKGMDYNKAVETCQHEAAHELFAEVCEKNTTLCLETQEKLNANN